MFQICARAEVYQFHLLSLDIDEQIIVLEVTVNDTDIGALFHDADDLFEQFSSLTLAQEVLLTDVREQVSNLGRPFHDDHETVRTFKIIYQAYDPVDVAGFTQENHFEGYGLSVHVLRGWAGGRVKSRV